MKNTLQLSFSNLLRCGFSAVLGSAVMTGQHVFAVTPGVSAESKVITFDLPSDTLAKTLVKFATQAQVNIAVEENLVEDYRSSPLIGYLQPEQALTMLLSGRPFLFDFDKKSNTFTIKPKTSYRLVTVVKKESQLKELQLVTEELFVSGLKDSLTRSVDIKRYSRGIVDAVVAVDIRETPDSNLAESLQRIAGVSIDRLDDEGSQVTVRGIGPEFNMVTLNGRILARTTGDRSFDFSNIASEMVSAVKVHKTGDASIFSGGIGSTINLVSMRPLDTPGLKFTSSVNYVKDYSSEDVNGTAEAVALYSQSFDDRFGLALGLSFQERDYGRSEALVGTGWRTLQGERINDGGISLENRGAVPLENQINRPNSGDIYSVPQSVIYRFTEAQRQRINGHLVFQWQVREDLNVTLDYFHFERDLAVQHNEISAWFFYEPSQSVWSDGPLASPLIYSESYENSAGGIGLRDLPMAARDSAEKFKNDAFGFNLNWKPSDKWHFSVDVAISDASRRPDSPYGSHNSFTVSSITRSSASADFTEAFPALIIGGGNQVRASDMRVSGSTFTNEHYTSKVDQFQFDANYEFDHSGSVNFGIEHTTVMNNSRSVSVIRNEWGGVGAEGDFSDDFFPSRSILDRFDAASGDFSEELANGNTLADGTILNRDNIQDVFFDFDFQRVRDRAQLLYRDEPGFNNGVIGDCGSYFCASTDYSKGSNNSIEEKTLGAYLQLRFVLNEDQAPIHIDLGMRYEKTIVDAWGLGQIYDTVIWANPSSLSFLGPEQGVNIHKTGEYAYFLPNVNLMVETSENTKLRFSSSQTIGRANFYRLRSVTNISDSSIIDPGGVSGNPSLRPMQSNNIDLAFEWYAGELNYVALGFFRKSIQDYVVFDEVSKTSAEIFNADINLTHPAFGELASIAQVNIGSSNPALTRDYIFNNFSDLESVDQEREWIYATQEDEPLLFSITQPKNGADTYLIEGFELSLQGSLGDTGFGGFANYTIVYSDFNFDVTAFDTADVPIGVGDTANIVGFYEKSGVNVRLAWNWRDRFLHDVTQGTGSNPVYVEAYSQFDLYMGYQLTDNFEVFVEGFNLTEEAIRVHGRSDREVLNYIETGARWKLGVFYSF